MVTMDLCRQNIYRTIALLLIQNLFNKKTVDRILDLCNVEIQTKWRLHYLTTIDRRHF